MAKKIYIIGSGFSGLAAAASLGQMGYEVVVLEKNDTIGGRARQLKIDGYTFDMGPSWYWMPDVFETFFARFNKKPQDFFDLKQLSPSYQIVFEENKCFDIPSNFQDLKALFEKIEQGAGEKLDKFMEDAAYKYKVGIDELVYKPCHSVVEFINYQLILDTLKLNIFTSMRTHVRKFFKHPFLLKIMEFPVLFLGAKPSNTPSLYSLMNYADAKLGTWYPMGGMYEMVKAISNIALSFGVEIRCNQNVTGFTFDKSKITGIQVGKRTIPASLVIASADYHHIEMNLLPPQFQQYNNAYWEKRDLAPSALMFFLGINKRIPNLSHHTLFFDEPFEAHTRSIYDDKTWVDQPLFYVSMSSYTDTDVAPEGCENIVILIPVAAGLKSDEALREHYYNIVMDRLEYKVGENIRDHVVAKRSYAHEEFDKDYNAYKGNAYGLANTIAQTAFMKPKIKSKKLDNLYYTGQMTVPGPGVPPAIISGQIVAQEIKKDFPTS